MVVIKTTNKSSRIYFLLLFFNLIALGQSANPEISSQYKKRILDHVEINFLASYYTQNGSNAAVCGGVGTEQLMDTHPTIIISIPLNDDDILRIDASVSAYTSASSSNIDPFDGENADAFVASTGASSSDVWSNVTTSYSHSSDDRNRILSGNISFSTEYDYNSVGSGGSYTFLFNRKNTEVTLKANLFFDTWDPLYPAELEPFMPGGQGLRDKLFRRRLITGNTNYEPDITPFYNKSRNTYSVSAVVSQILSKRTQGSLACDFVQQHGLLSTPFQRVYFQDVANSFIDQFQLADDIERLPSNRYKFALGTRFNFYLNEFFIFRSSHRFYWDSWQVVSHAIKVGIPIKINSFFTLYPTYRFYIQTRAKYFLPYEQHLSSEKYYTSDYDLSAFRADEFGFGISYTDIFVDHNLWRMGFKSIDLRMNRYQRDSGLSAFLLSFGFTLIFI